ncbi:MAG: hypothetical protein PF440_03045 [Thiomicrorhabdus sp.]|jgi:hypothetical protein|nr:hypothetical protein [Thiomicrorhabdus sp.]
MIKVTNDIDKLYDSGSKSHADGTFSCPVCDKVYKTEKGITGHMTKRDCFSLLSIFKNTINETKGYAIYKQLIVAYKPTANVMINTFRKSPFYNGTLRFVAFSAIHGVDFDMLVWLHEYKKCNQINKILSEAIKESNLKEFRMFLQLNGEILIDNGVFYGRYRDDMIEDEDYLVRSLEKAHISLAYLANKKDFPFDDVVSKLSYGYRMRFEQIVLDVLGE